MVTLGLYLAATVATAFAFAPWFFFACRALTGMGIGGEYSAITSAVDEPIPARRPLDRGALRRRLHGDGWRPGRSRAALRMAAAEGRAAARPT